MALGWLWLHVGIVLSAEREYSCSIAGKEYKANPTQWTDPSGLETPVSPIYVNPLGPDGNSSWIGSERTSPLCDAVQIQRRKNSTAGTCRVCANWLAGGGMSSAMRAFEKIDQCFNIYWSPL